MLTLLFLSEAVGASPPVKEKPKLNPCSSLPCQHGGQCVVQGDGFRCICPEDYTGATCELPVRVYCHPNPCLHGGTCLEEDKGYTCKCVGAYRGQTCEVDDCDQCDIHAICVKGACRCRVGYKGDGFQCEKIKRCHHCSKFASCVENQCICNTGYTGNGQVCQAPPTVSSACPAQCATTCIPSCPQHCCQVTIIPDACPSECSVTKCGPSCPARCCNQSPACPSNCNTEQCSPACPVQCCQPCSPACRDDCTPQCPIRCCLPPQTVAPSAASIATACPAHCGYECSSSCPEHCCLKLEDSNTQNAVSRTLGNHKSHKDDAEGPSERRAKLLSILLPSPREICPQECQTSSCSYLCPAQCCGKAADRVKHLKREKIARKPSETLKKREHR